MGAETALLNTTAGLRGSFLSKTFSGCGSTIVKHDCGTVVAAFLSRTFGGPGILQFSQPFRLASGDDDDDVFNKP